MEADEEQDEEQSSHSEIQPQTNCKRFFFANYLGLVS